MAVAFGVEALEQALSQGPPEIFTTAPGAQCTSQDFTLRLQQGGIRVSMAGRGRALDHVCVERLGRRVTYEAVDQRDYPRVWDARQSLARYGGFYKGARLHQALGDRTPAAAHSWRVRAPRSASRAPFALNSARCCRRCIVSDSYAPLASKPHLFSGPLFGVHYTYLLQQVRTYDLHYQQSRRGRRRSGPELHPPIGTISCAWASDVQQILNEYATRDGRVFEVFRPKSSSEIYSPFDRKLSEQ